MKRKKNTNYVGISMSIVLFFFTAVFVFLAFLSMSIPWTEYKTIKIDNNIERAIKAKEFDYKFVEFRSIGLLGGGGAGGQGEAVIWMKNAKQFLNEVPKGEKIYLTKEKTYNPGFQKIYIASIPERDYLIGYKETYEAKDSLWEIKSQSKNNITFAIPRDEGWFFLVILFAIIAFFSFIGAFSLLGQSI